MVALPGNMNLTVGCVDCEADDDPEMVPVGPLIVSPNTHTQQFECPVCKKEISITLYQGEPLIGPRTAKGSLD